MDSDDINSRLYWRVVYSRVGGLFGGILFNAGRKELNAFKMGEGDHIKPNDEPLTPEQEKALIECYNRQIHHIEPVVDCTNQTTFQLIERGMLSAKTFIKNKKALFSFYVTDMGVEYLTQLGVQCQL